MQGVWESLQVVWKFCSASEIAPCGKEAHQGSWAIPGRSPVPTSSLMSRPPAVVMLHSSCGRAFTDLPTDSADSCLWASVHAAARIWNTFFTGPRSTRLPGFSFHCEVFSSYAECATPLMSLTLALLYLLCPAVSHLIFICTFSLPYKCYSCFHCNLYPSKNCLYSLFFCLLGKRWKYLHWSLSGLNSSDCVNIVGLLVFRDLEGHFLC